MRRTRSRPWRADEKRDMTRWRRAGMSDQYIADKLRRSRKSVRHQRNRMGLNDPVEMAWTASKLRKEISERQLRLERQGGDDGE